MKCERWFRLDFKVVRWRRRKYVERVERAGEHGVVTDGRRQLDHLLLAEAAIDRLECRPQVAATFACAP